MRRVKKKQLVVVPTTAERAVSDQCGHCRAQSLKTKKGIAVERNLSDIAVLVPETITDFRISSLLQSSVDALIHALNLPLAEGSPFTEMYSLQAHKMIMEGYKEIVANGEDARFKYLKNFVLASNYAGIAFGNAGCAAVHALSYSIGGAFHVPHGEANYQFFTEVFKMYMRKDPKGKIVQATKIFADALGCDPEGDVYGELEKFLNKLIVKKPLREYGMVESQIDEFTDMTIANQQRLLANNYVFLDRDEIREIFANLY